jgi:ABC-type bacteriocin/lantibiotic exporter with double-glycine peptidase domain
MKFDSTMIAVLLAAFAPLIGLIVAILWERERRKRTEKPPQTEKLLRPPGFSLLQQLNEAIDTVIFESLTACVFSLCSIPFFQTLILLTKAATPLSWLIFWVIATGIFSGLSVLCVCRAVKKYRKAQIHSAIKRQTVARRIHEQSRRYFLSQRTGKRSRHFSAGLTRAALRNSFSNPKTANKGFGPMKNVAAFYLTDTKTDTKKLITVWLSKSDYA